MIGGNMQAILQIKTEVSSEIGESKYKWSNGILLNGYLDLSGGDSHYTAYNAKVQESTHIFLCDYVDMGSINSRNSRLIINDRIYDVVLIDNPMELNKHLEIYLKLTE